MDSDAYTCRTCKHDRLANDCRECEVEFESRRRPANMAPDDDLLSCNVAARPLNYPLSDYHHAMSSGPLNYTWRDKPHRLVYDLIAAVKWYATQQPVQPAPSQPKDTAPVLVWTPESLDAAKARAAEYAPWFVGEQGDAKDALTDEQIEDLVLKSGGKWDGNVWRFENADLHPFVRTVLARS